MQPVGSQEVDKFDKTTLERLNQEYVDAFMNADVDWYREHLAEDFICVSAQITRTAGIGRGPYKRPK